MVVVAFDSVDSVTLPAVGALVLCSRVEAFFPLGVVLDPVPYVCPGHACSPLLPPASDLKRAISFHQWHHIPLAKTWRELLRRLMSNCGRRGRSQNSMLLPNLRPKVVPHGPRLLPRLIVRIGGRLVAGWPWSGPAPPGSSGPAHGPGGHHPGHPGPVAPLPQREGLLALRFLSPAPLLPAPLLPGSVQPQGASPGARVARLAAGFCKRPHRSFGRLPRDGHYPHPGHRAGEGQRS